MNRAAGKLGDYELLRELQTGGMGTVHLARKRGAAGFEKLLAVKIMRGDLRDVDAVRKMFLDEAQLLARIEHPAVARVYDFGDDDGAMYLVMEYVAGVNVRDVVDLRPSPGVALRIIAQACRGLHAAHELTDLAGNPMNVVHRDVSPENLMLTFDGQVKVLDFGIALMRDRQAPVTEFGTIKGKPPYLAPEQIKNEAIDRRTDVFAACIVLHELLTGEPVFTGSSVYAVARAIEHDEVAPPSARAGALSPGLDAAVLRGLKHAPDERYSTALLLAERLEEIADTSGAESLASYAERELADERKRHRDELRRLLSGTGQVPTRSRPTGAVTALASTLPGPDGVAEVAIPVKPETPADVAESPDTAATAATVEPPPTWMRGLRVVALVAVCAVLGGGTALVVRGAGPTDRTIRDGERSEAAAPDGPGDSTHRTTRAKAEPVRDEDERAAAESDPPGDRDRGPVVSPPAEKAAIPAAAGAAERRDARRRRRPRRASRDDAKATAGDGDPRPAAASTEASFGYVSVVARGSTYAIVQIDGKNAGTTPIFKRKLATGTHEIVLVDPATDAVRARKTVTLTAGEHRRVAEP